MIALHDVARRSVRDCPARQLHSLSSLAVLQDCVAMRLALRALSGQHLQLAGQLVASPGGSAAMHKPNQDQFQANVGSVLSALL